MMPVAGTVLDGRYELAEQIGRGGYGQVWRAIDTVLSRPVAIKLLYPGYACQPEALARFHAEAQHAGALAHHNIARVYDYGEPGDGSSPYLVMEVIDGPALSDILADGPLDVARSMDVIAQAAAGLEAAHAIGLVHRDVKPANLLLDSAGTVKITDFGIANTIGSVSLTGPGELLGTPGYLAPERVAGLPATSASDLYALGIVAYECLVGTAPFEGTVLEIAVAHEQRPLPPLPPSVPSDVAAFVMRLTEKDPAWRPGSAAEVSLCASQLRDRLPAVQYHQGPDDLAMQSPVAAEPRPSRVGRVRQRTLLALAMVVLAGLTGLVTSLTVFSSGSSSVLMPSSPARPPAHSSGTHSPVTGIAAQRGSSPSTDPVNPISAVRRQPSANPATVREPTGTDAATSPSPPGPANGKGKGNGHGKGKGNGNGKGKGNGRS